MCLDLLAYGIKGHFNSITLCYITSISHQESANAVVEPSMLDDALSKGKCLSEICHKEGTNTF